MSEAIPIGPAYAWEEHGRWCFTPLKMMEPPDAIEVELRTPQHLGCGVGSGPQRTK